MRLGGDKADGGERGGHDGNGFLDFARAVHGVRFDFVAFCGVLAGVRAVAGRRWRLWRFVMDEEALGDEVSPYESLPPSIRDALPVEDTELSPGSSPRYRNLAGFDFMSQPPPLCHQRSSDGCLYRTSPPGCSADAYDDEEEFPVWRSCAPPLAAGGVPAASYRGLAAGDSFGEEQQVFRDLKPVMAAIPRTLSRTLSSPGGSPRCNIGDLPSDLLHLVLLRLAPCPDLFSAGAVCKAWADAARASYTLRRVRVPPTPDARLGARQLCESGDELELLPGSTCSRASSRSRSRSASTPPPPRRRRSPAAAAASSSSSAAAAAPAASSSAAAAAAAAAPLAPPCSWRPPHPAARRHAAVLDGLWMCRMGDEVGYPNASSSPRAASCRCKTAA